MEFGDQTDNDCNGLVDEDTCTETSTEIMFFFKLDTGKEGNVLFNDALNTFYLRLYGVRGDSERGKLLSPLHGLNEKN